MSVIDDALRAMHEAAEQLADQRARIIRMENALVALEIISHVGLACEDYQREVRRIAREGRV